MNNSELPSIIIAFIRALSATSSIIAVIMLSRNWRNQSIESIGRDSLIIYLVHDYGVTGSIIVARKIITSTSIMILLGFVCGLIVSFVVYIATKKWRLLEFVFYPTKVLRLNK